MWFLKFTSILVWTRKTKPNYTALIKLQPKSNLRFYKTVLEKKSSVSREMLCRNSRNRLSLLQRLNASDAWKFEGQVIFYELKSRPEKGWNIWDLAFFRMRTNFSYDLHKSCFAFVFAIWFCYYKILFLIFQYLISTANLAAQCYVLPVILMVKKCDSNSAELNCCGFLELSRECPS